MKYSLGWVFHFVVFAVIPFECEVSCTGGPNVASTSGIVDHTHPNTGTGTLAVNTHTHLGLPTDVPASAVSIIEDLVKSAWPEVAHTWQLPEPLETVQPLQPLEPFLPTEEEALELQHEPPTGAQAVQKRRMLARIHIPNLLRKRRADEVRAPVSPWRLMTPISESAKTAISQGYDDMAGLLSKIPKTVALIQKSVNTSPWSSFAGRSFRVKTDEEIAQEDGDIAFDLHKITPQDYEFVLDRYFQETR